MDFAFDDGEANNSSRAKDTCQSNGADETRAKANAVVYMNTNADSWSKNECIFRARAWTQWFADATTSVWSNLAFSPRTAAPSRLGYLRLSAPQGCGYPITYLTISTRRGGIPSWTGSKGELGTQGASDRWRWTNRWSIRYTKITKY